MVMRMLICQPLGWMLCLSFDVCEPLNAICTLIIVSTLTWEWDCEPVIQIVGQKSYYLSGRQRETGTGRCVYEDKYIKQKYEEYGYYMTNLWLVHFPLNITQFKGFIGAVLICTFHFPSRTVQCTHVHNPLCYVLVLKK